MAGLKEIKSKIKSISNTRKITRTMEMVAAAKSKQTTKRVESSTPYSKKLAELMESLSTAGTVDHFLVREPEKLERNALLVITANRGLCGGYNTNVANLAERWVQSEAEAGRETEISIVGKKGIARFRFRRIPVRESFTHFDDRPAFRDAEVLATAFMERFRRGEVSRVMVASTRYHSAGMQRPALVQLLPIEAPRRDDGTARAATNFSFEPEPRRILEDLLPFSVKHALYRLFLEAAASEQIARRIAMKLATDNAGELIRFYTRKYNRERQATITQQIMEIVGGAEALS